MLCSSKWTRAFIPFWIALVLSAGILAVDYHLRNAPLTHFTGRVFVTGRGTAFDSRLLAHGKTLRFGDTVRIGPATVTVTAPEAEPREVSRFVWYGPNPLGDVFLEPSRGTLEILPQPSPDQFELKGLYESRTNATGTFPGVMTGEYQATLVYGNLRRSHPVSVTRNQTTTDKRLEKIGMVNLDSDPSKGTYEINSNSGTVEHSGPLPAGILFLPEGRYEAVVRHGEEERRQPFNLKPNETNRMVLRFTYGSLELSSEPSDATVLLKANRLGQTPLTLNHFATGKHSFQLVKEGYDPAWLEVEITEAATNTEAVVLVDTQYRQSMNAATQAVESKQFDQALNHLRTALNRKPEDKPALKLQNQAQAGLFQQQAAEAVRREEFARAIGLLDKALEMLPGDADALDQKTQTITAQKAFEARLKQERFAELQIQAPRLIDNGDFDRAEQALDEAGKLSPQWPDMAALRERIRQGREKLRAEQSKKRREQEISLKRGMADYNFDLAVKDEPSFPLFRTMLWRTTKSKEEVVAACERVSASIRGFKMERKPAVGENEAALKFGSLFPVLRTGTFIRLNVSEIDTKDTEIRLKVFAFTLNGGSTPVPMVDTEALKTFIPALAKELNGDLRK